jgi:hypothetical protein
VLDVAQELLAERGRGALGIGVTSPVAMVVGRLSVTRSAG